MPPAMSLSRSKNVCELYSSFATAYCKTLNVSVPFISRISRAKQNRKFKAREYKLQPKIERNYYIISNCVVLIRQNERGQNNFAC